MVNLQLLKAYFRHLWKANTRHGTHSPFVYQLVDEVVYNLKHEAAYREIEELRGLLLKNEDLITITDLGAGSHVNNNQQKRIKQIAANALKPARLAQLIYRLVKANHPQNIIELGTCLGLTTAYLAKAAPEASVISIEGCPQTMQVAAQNLKQLNLERVKLLNGNFDELFPDVIANLSQLDVVYIDGNHRKEATLNYFDWCLPKVHENTLLIFDDIYWSKGMEQAWEQIKTHPQVTITVDLFWIGLVYFRKGQAREHFRIKF